MQVYCVDPIRDPRWDQLVLAHAGASVFHTPAWLEALRRSYGYESLALTTSPPDGPILNGMVLARIKSWLTGSRLVSVPFADHCHPLLRSAEELEDFAGFFPGLLAQERCSYVELRLMDRKDDLAHATTRLSPSASYAYHVLDLRPDPDALYQALHPSCCQRKIRRAEKESLSYCEGTSDAILGKFYFLFVQTRRRHGLPPQPLKWFRNLRDCFGGGLKIRIASKGDKAVAAILTLQHQQTIVYKYGASDPAFHRLGSMPFLFWHTILDARQQGASELDLGRSDIDDSGLVAFKNHLGAAISQLTYYRYPPRAAVPSALRRLMRPAKVFAQLPSPVLKIAGNFLYRHAG